MTTKLKLLNQNNKKMSGGGNVKQGIVPAATKFYGMRLKTNLNAARNNGASGAPYYGVCFEEFDGSVKCKPSWLLRGDGLSLGAALLTGHGAEHDIVGYVGSDLHHYGPDYDVGGSLTPSSAHGTEILGVYTHLLPPHPHMPPQQIHIGISGKLPTSFTFVGGDLGAYTSYTLKTADAHYKPDIPSVWPWLNQGFDLTPGVTYTVFID